MKGQKINITVAGRPYQMTAVSPSMERYIRLAANEINESLDQMNLSYSEALEEDKLSILAVRQSVARQIAEQQQKDLKAELEALNKRLESYLEVKP